MSQISGDETNIIFIPETSILQHGNYASHVLTYKDADKNIGDGDKNIGESTKILVIRQKYWCTRKILLLLSLLLLLLLKFCIFPKRLFSIQLQYAI